MKYLFIFFLIITLSCCSNNSTKEHDNVLTIDYKNLEEIRLSDYVDNIKVVKLETSDDVLIGEIIKVEIFNNRIYVLDRQSNALFVFTDEGKILYKLRNIGNGPGEYIELFDFDVTNDGVYLSNIGSRAILYYDNDFNFIRKINRHSMAGDFAMNDEYFWIFREPLLTPYNQILMIDKNGSTVEEFFPKKATESKASISSNVFQKQKSDIYFSPRYGNTVYKWNNENKWQEFITLSFGDKTLDKDINEYYSNKDVNYADFPYIVRRSFFVFHNFLMFDFYIYVEPYLRPHCCFYDLKTKETKAGKVKNDLIPDYESWFPMSYNGHTSQSNNCFIECIAPEWILDEEYAHYKGLYKLDESLKDLIEDDNPVLLIYEFK